MSKVKANLYYTKDHEWIDILEDDTAYVGITDYAQSELGEIVFVDVPTIGEQLNQFDTFGSIEAVKTVADLNIPMSGEVIEINEKLDNEPELVNNEPYDNGWIVKMNIANISETKNLMTVEEYNKYIGQ